MLYQMVDENEDVSKVVTTKITRMLYLFSDSVDHSFNQDIGSWNVGDVFWSIIFQSRYQRLGYEQCKNYVFYV